MRTLRPSAGRSVAAALLAGLILTAGPAAGPAAAAPVAGSEAAAPAAGPQAAPAGAPPAATDGTAGGHHGGLRHETALLAKAPADECFVDIGVDYPAGPPCATGQPKVNQAYVWGLTRYKHRLWFGTGANINCMTSGNNLRNTTPTRNADWVCEYGQSQIARQNPQLPPTLGDHRTPRLYTYDTKSRQLIERTDAVRAASPDDAQRLATTAGIRAAGNHRGVVLFGGPALGATLNLFAFDADTGAFLGSRNFAQYGNIRHFVVADGELYTGVGVGPNGGDRGLVLRWTGGKSNPFSFTEVANLPAQAVDLAAHQGRIYVTTWVGAEAAVAATGTAPESPTADIADAPTATDPAPPNVAGVWMSPKLSDNGPGLDERDADKWARVWSVLDYEPDPVVARTYGLGGLASYNGQLYWGTMHVPLKATTVHLTVYPPTSEQGARDTVRNTQRAIGIFRGSFQGQQQRVELLYGAAQLPAYLPGVDGGAGQWVTTPTGYTPRYGPSGFGNPFLNYTWKMVVAGGRLYVGTMDWSYLAKELAPPESVPVAADEEPDYGADLYVFDATNRPAIAVDTTGLGNYLNYGVRSMVVDGTTVYIGTANPMNLRTDPTDDVPEGGWELLRLTPKHGPKK